MTGHRATPMIDRFREMATDTLVAIATTGFANLVSAYGNQAGQARAAARQILAKRGRVAVADCPRCGVEVNVWRPGVDPVPITLGGPRVAEALARGGLACAICAGTLRGAELF